jgi:hypothetical protein
MRIKLFEQFYKATVLDEVNDCLVDLRDKGFAWHCELPTALNLPQQRGSLYMSLYKIDKSSFTTDDIKDSIETMIEYFDEKYGVKEYSLTKPDSPGPGIEIKLYDEDDDSVIARHSRLKKLYHLNIKISLGNEN